MDDPLNAIRARILEDRDSGSAKSLAEYARLFPGEDVLVAQVYADVHGTAASSAASPGSDTLAHYKILKELGRGGQGVVYLAEDTRLHRKVALKVLTGLGPGSEDSVQRLRREAEVASRLEHPGICGVHDAGVANGTPYIAMHYVEGATLADRISKTRGQATEGEPSSVVLLSETTDAGSVVEKRIPSPTATTLTTKDEIPEILRVFEKAAHALHAAHEAGVVHRDIKPGNIMVTAAGQPVILDFGLARAEDMDLQTLTKTGDVFGTPAYMSPEQISGQRIRLDRRSDVYSLGVTLYECLTRRRPFEAPTREGVYQAVMTKSPQDPRKLNRAISKDLKVVLETALEKDRDRRYATADALAKDLQAVLESRPIQARPVGPVGRFVRWSKREPAKAALLGVLLVAFPTIATLVTSHVKDRPQVEAARLARIEQAKDEILSEASYEVSEGDPRKAIELYTRALGMEGDSPEAAGGLVLASLRLGNPGEALRLLDMHRPLLGEGAAACWLRADALRALGRKDEAKAIEGGAPAPRSTFEHQLIAQKQLQKGEAGDEAAFGGALRHVTTAILLSSGPRLSLYTLRAHAAGHTKDRAAAVETAAGLRQGWPGSAGAHYWSGFALDRTNDGTLLDEAIAAYREAIHLKPDYARARSNLGLALSAKGLHDEAIAECREAIRRSPTFGYAYFSLGGAFLEKGLSDEAIAAYREAIRLNPDFATYNNLGAALTRKGLLDDAIAAYREAIRLKPAFADAHVNHGFALAEKGLLDEAVAACREAIRLDPGSVRPRVGLSDVLVKQGLIDDAIAVSREMVRVNPSDAIARGSLGDALFAKGLIDDAIAAYREAIRLRPSFSEAHHHLGAVLAKKGLLDDSLAALREAIRLKPDSEKAYQNLGCVLIEKGLVDDAIAALHEAIRLKPDSLDAQNALGEALKRKGLLDDTIASRRESIRLDPRGASAHYNLGSALQRNGLLDDAMSSYREAIRLKPDYAEAHCNLAGLLRFLGQLRESLAEYRLGHEIGSQQPEWRYPSEQWVADAEQLVDDEEEREARLSGHVAKGTQPDEPSELVALAQVALKKGRPALAARWYRAAFEESPDFAEAIETGNRRLAARAAVLTSIGETDSAPALDDAARTSWRLQALAWLEAETGAIRKARETTPLTSAQIRMALVPLTRSPDFASVRGPDAIAKLPAAEQVRWTKLWADIDALLTSLDRKPDSRAPETRR